MNILIAIAVRVPAARVIIDDTFLIARTKITASGIKEYQCTRFIFIRVFCKFASWVKSAEWSSGDRNPNKISEMKNAGIVVQDIFLICSNRSTLTVDEASTVVSDSGDILSPRKAPEITAPAVIAREKPSASLTAMKATPITADVVNELPMLNPTIDVMIKTIA